MRTIIALLAFVGLLTLPRTATAQTSRYKVIVNASNAASVLRASELSKIFLGTATVWPDRTLVLAVDQKAGSPLREKFVREIISKDSVALSRYWEQAVFSGRAIPPLTLADDLEIVDFVRRNPGAIGYVSASTLLGPEAKVLNILY